MNHVIINTRKLLWNNFFTEATRCIDVSIQNDPDLASKEKFDGSSEDEFGFYDLARLEKGKLLTVCRCSTFQL